MMPWLKITMRYALLAVSCFSTVAVNAEDLLMVRSEQPFPETMLNLKESIKDHGYIVTRVQRVDVGLKKYGFRTDKYRVVFFGKKSEIQRLGKRYPELIPYLPLNFTVFAEADDTIITAVNPVSLKSHYPDSALSPVFSRWETDIRDILEGLSVR